MIECPYRKEQVHQLKSDLCGWRGTMQPIFRCELFQLCTYRPVRSDQKERVCLRCEKLDENSWSCWTQFRETLISINLMLSLFFLLFSSLQAEPETNHHPSSKQWTTYIPVESWRRNNPKPIPKKIGLGIKATFPPLRVRLATAGFLFSGIQHSPRHSD